MNLCTTRWLLAPLRQWRTRRLMAQHGSTLPYDTAWALITLVSAPDEADLVRAWANESFHDTPGVHYDQPGVHYDQWHQLSEAEQIRRRRWLHRHGHSPIRILHLGLDGDLIKSAGIHVLDWAAPPPLP